MDEVDSDEINVEMKFDERWAFQLDMNRDGAFTISDVGAWLSYVFFAPGDGLFSLMLWLTPGLSRFFEILPRDFGGVASGVISVLVWLLVLAVIFKKIGPSSFFHFDRND